MLLTLPFFTHRRGRRRVLPNPDYAPELDGLPRPPNPRSLLPPEHPDYEPDLRCPPKVLWPQAGKASAKRKRGQDMNTGTVSVTATDRSKRNRSGAALGSTTSSPELAFTPARALMNAPGPQPLRKEDSW